MEHPTINDLPNELLEVIFDHLDVDDLKDASLVCKRWSDLTISGRRMDLVKLVPNFPWDKHLLQSNRKYRHLELEETEKCSAHVKELFEAVNVCSLRIKDRDLSHSSLRLILLEVPNLQHLSIVSEPAKMNEMIEPLPVMRKLERLEIENGNSTSAIHWHTIAPSLHGLKMNCDDEQQLEQWRLFSGQLKQAYAICYVENLLNRFWEMTFPLLEELSIKLKVCCSGHQEFAQRHDCFRRNTSLRLLRLDGIYLSKTLVEDITNHSKKLSSLEISNIYYSERGFLESLSQLPELKHLKMEEMESHMFGGCEALTSLQSLSIHCISFDISEIAPQLRCLQFGSAAIRERDVQYICDNFLKLTRLQLTCLEKEARDCFSRIDRLQHLRYLDLKLFRVNTFFKGIVPQNKVRHLILNLHYEYDYHEQCNDGLLQLPEIFPQLKRLIFINLGWCLRKTTIDRLRELIPSCVIITYGQIVSNEEIKFVRKWPRDRMTPAWEKEWIFRDRI